MSRDGITTGATSPPEMITLPSPSETLNNSLSQYISCSSSSGGAKPTASNHRHAVNATNNHNAAATPPVPITGGTKSLKQLKSVLERLRVLHDLLMQMRQCQMYHYGSVVADVAAKEQQQQQEASASHQAKTPHWRHKMQLLNKFKMELLELEQLVEEDSDVKEAHLQMHHQQQHDTSIAAADSTPPPPHHSPAFTPTANTKPTTTSSHVFIIREFKKLYLKAKRDLECELMAEMDSLFGVRFFSGGDGFGEQQKGFQLHTAADSLVDCTKFHLHLPKHQYAFIQHLFHHRTLYFNNILLRLKKQMESSLRHWLAPSSSNGDTLTTQLQLDTYRTERDLVVELTTVTAQSETHTIDVIRHNLGVLCQLNELLLEYLSEEDKATKHDEKLKEAFINYFSNPFTVSMFQLVVDHHLSQEMDTQNMQQFQNLVREFLSRLEKECSIVEPIQKLQEEYVDRIGETCIQKRCDFTFRQARHALVHLYNEHFEQSALSANPKSLHYFPSCLVSRGVEKLVRLVEDMLKEHYGGEGSGTSGTEGNTDVNATSTDGHTTKNHPHPPPLVKKSLLDVLHLFQVLIPSRYSRELTNPQHPQKCMQFYCNAMYLAHNISLLHMNYMNLQDSNLTHLSMEYKKMAAHYFTNQYKQQVSELKQIIKSVGGFGDVSTNFDHAESKMNQLTKRLNNLAVELKPLPQAMYIQTFASLVSECMQEICNDILRVKDIGADECHLIQELIQPLCEFTQDWFGVEESHKLLGSVLNRYESIIKILSMPLVQIAPAFHVGNLRGLSAKDVTHLIRAIFSSTLKRSQAIYDVQNGE